MPSSVWLIRKQRAVPRRANIAEVEQIALVPTVNSRRTTRHTDLLNLIEVVRTMEPEELPHINVVDDKEAIIRIALDITMEVVALERVVQQMDVIALIHQLT